MWQKVPDAFRAHANDEGVIRARNEGMWVTGTKETPGYDDRPPMESPERWTGV